MREIYIYTNFRGKRFDFSEVKNNSDKLMIEFHG